MLYKIYACDLEFCKQNSICFSAEKQTTVGQGPFLFRPSFKKVAGSMDSVPCCSQGEHFFRNIKTTVKGVEKYMSEEKKNCQLNLRLTPSELRELQKKAEISHMSVSGYIMTLSENKKITVAENIPELLLEITRIGTNINQIAHIGNSQKYVNKQQLDGILNLLEDVKSIMQKILSELYNEDEHTFRSLERKIDMLLEKVDKDGNS